MDDPKKRPAAPPEAPRASPRGNQSDGIETMAERGGHCVQCGKPYSYGERIVVNLANAGPSGMNDGWCPPCWNATHTNEKEQK